MNDPDYPDLRNDDSSAWGEATATDSDYFFDDRDTSNILLSDFSWNLSESVHHQNLTDVTPIQPSIIDNKSQSNLPSSSSSSAAVVPSIAVTEVSVENSSAAATSSSSEDPVENSTASAAKTPPETPGPIVI